MLIAFFEAIGKMQFHDRDIFHVFFLPRSMFFHLVSYFLYILWSLYLCFKFPVYFLLYSSHVFINKIANRIYNDVSSIKIVQSAFSTGPCKYIVETSTKAQKLKILKPLKPFSCDFAAFFIESRFVFSKFICPVFPRSLIIENEN